MPFGQPQDDDEQIPQYSNLTTLLAGTPVPAYDPQQQAVAAAPQAVAPQQIPQAQQAVPAAPMAAAPQGQPPTATAAPQSAPQSPAIVLPPPPTAPQMDMQKYQALEDQVKKFGQPTNRNDAAVKPHWYDRLAGGTAGFLLGASGHPEQGVQVGSGITNRAYNAAEEDRQTREASAKQELGDFEHQYDLQTKGFETAARGWGLQREADQTAYSRDRDAKGDAAGAAATQYSHGRDAIGDKRNADNDAEHRHEFEVNSTREAAQQAETARHNKADEGAEGARNAETRRHNQATEKDDAKGDTSSPTNSRVKGEQLNKLNLTRQGEYRAEEKGDPKTGEEGFQQKLQALQTAKINPATNKPFTPDERSKAIADLQSDHNTAKDGIENEYATGLNNLGVKGQPVQYDQDGHPLNNTDGSPAGQRQVPPAPAAPPQKRESQTATKPVEPKAGQQRQLTDVNVARQYLTKAGGDKAKARTLAAKDGYVF